VGIAGGHRWYFSRRSVADLLLFGFTLAELAVLVALTPTFTFLDWVYLLQHVAVLVIALIRWPATARDFSPLAFAACFVGLAYPYAQVIWLRFAAGHAAWPGIGDVLVTLAAFLSFAGLLALGRRFGIRPALRGVVTRGPYRLVRHPIYLSYLVADVGFNLQEWNAGTLLLTLMGWASLLYRIRAEERVLAQDSHWAAYAARVRYRLFPGVW
jgi:protein-S-isoprenylcysteine O-methyltransferase Ste14